MEVKIKRAVRVFIGGEMISPVPPVIQGDVSTVRLLCFLEELFQGFQQVFVGSMTNIIKVAGGGLFLTGKEVLRGFQQLEEIGWMTIDGDEFTPTRAYLEARTLKTSHWHRES